MAGVLEVDWVRVGTSEQVREAGTTVVTAAQARIAVFTNDRSGELCAVDNRCPHMGFPLEKGTVRDGILTCHWHQARFDLRSGCTFDLWADDVPRYEVRTDAEDTVWVSSTPAQRLDQAYHLRRLRRGLEQDVVRERLAPRPEALAAVEIEVLHVRDVPLPRALDRAHDLTCGRLVR